MITDVDELYFKWLMQTMGNPTESLTRLCWMIHQNTFTRAVGNDVNRAVNGMHLRNRFVEDFLDAGLDERKTNSLMDEECSWFEMLVALSESLDFLYDGGVQENFLELVGNLGLTKILASPRDGRYDQVDQDLVDAATSRVDNNHFDPDGLGGLFPLHKRDHPDQREVEIWEQHAAYFREKLEGVVWTSIN